MNPRTPLLALSLVANAALLVAYVATPTAAERAAAPDRYPAGSGGAPAATGALTGSGSVAGGVTGSAAATVAPASFSWTALETDDLDELARRLKAAGFTAREIRLILGQLISNASQLAGTGPATPYWRSPRRNAPDAKAQEEQRKRLTETMRLQRKYLWNAESLVDDPERLEAAQRRWGNLPLEKLQALTTIEADYQELQMKDYTEQRVRPGETFNQEASRLLQKERMADIAKVLTPEEYAEFELRASDAAEGLRYQLEAFRASEQEYKIIFAIHKSYQERLSDPKLDPDGLKALSAERTAKVAAVLGPERALDYDAAMNYESRDQTALLVARLNLPARVGVEVRQTQQDFTKRGADIRANPALSAEERNTQLATLAQQAAAQLTAKLGQDGFEAYSDLKGDWLRALQPKPNR